MAINITFLEPPENKLMMPDLKAEINFDYQPATEQINGEELLKEINMDYKTISFVLVNNKTRYITKDFLKLVLNNGDSIKIFPFLISG